MILLYIDPGTGSMLFSIMIGIVSTLLFFFHRIFMKIKFIINGGKQVKASSKKTPYVIFSDDKRYWNNFKPICDEFEKRKINLLYLTASPDDPALKTNYNFIKTEFIGEGNKAFAHLNILNATICLSTTPGLDVYQWKRSRNCDYYVHIPHALDEMMGYHMFGLDFYDAVLLTGDFQRDYIRRLETMRNLPQKELVTVGYPLMDEQKKLLDSLNKTNSQETTILVAPSWGSNGILSKFGSTFLRAIQNTGFNVIIRPHPQSVLSEKSMLDKLMKEFPDTSAFQWNFDNNNFDCMNKASILISDFSGIIFEFAFLFDKPIIYADTEFKPDIYDAAWFKNEKIWKFAVLEKMGIQLDEEQFPDLKTIIQNTLNDKSLQTGREEARNQAWMHTGKSAELITNYLIDKCNSFTHENK